MLPAYTSFVVEMLEIQFQIVRSSTASFVVEMLEIRVFQMVRPSTALLSNAKARHITLLTKLSCLLQICRTDHLNQMI